MGNVIAYALWKSWLDIIWLTTDSFYKAKIFLTKVNFYIFIKKVKNNKKCQTSLKMWCENIIVVMIFALCCFISSLHTFVYFLQKLPLSCVLLKTLCTFNNGFFSGWKDGDFLCLFALICQGLKEWI